MPFSDSARLAISPRLRARGRGTTLNSMRLLFFTLAVVSIVPVSVEIMGGPHALPVRLAAIGCAMALIVYWTVGLGRGRFPRAGEPLEDGHTLGRLASFIIEDQRAALRRRRAKTVSVALDDDIDL